MSGRRPRRTPRWSVAGAGREPALMAGDPDSRAWVIVGPPLLAKAPSLGLVFWRSPSPVRPQVWPLSRLFPASVSGVAPFIEMSQFVSVPPEFDRLPAMIVLCTV